MAPPSYSKNHDWGYVIYRTVYSEESDLICDSVIAKLYSHVLRSIWRQWNKPHSASKEGDAKYDDEATESQCSYFHNIVLSDREKYEGKSLVEIEKDLNRFLKELGGRKLYDRGIPNSICLVIDEEVLHALRDGVSSGPPTRAAASPSVWIKIVDGVWHDDAVAEPSPYGDDDEPDEPDELIDSRYKGWVLMECQLLMFSHGSLDREWSLGHLVYCKQQSYFIRGILHSKIDIVLRLKRLNGSGLPGPRTVVVCCWIDISDELTRYHGRMIIAEDVLFWCTTARHGHFVIGRYSMFEVDRDINAQGNVDLKRDWSEST